MKEINNMSAFTAKEITYYFESYGPKGSECNETLVQEWMNDPNTGIINNPICEDDLDRFKDWCRWKGTAYETGIDDKTKIARLLEETTKLRKEIEVLEEVNKELDEHIDGFF